MGTKLRVNLILKLNKLSRTLHNGKFDFFLREKGVVAK